MARSRRIALATIAALALLAAPTAALAASVRQTVAAVPGATNIHYRSTLVRVSPIVAGVSWRVLDYNDEIFVTNHSRETVTIFGYTGEPYARILADGKVQLNQNSPAYYLNQSFYAAGVTVPSYATSTATPDWVTVAKTGTYVWHDHRIHLYSPALPPVVKNRGLDKTTLVFDWKVPIQIGAAKGDLYGTLYWIAEKPFAFPVGAIVAFIAIVLAGGALVVTVRRRRAASAGPSPQAW
jgi:hypothetical protein